MSHDYFVYVLVGAMTLASIAAVLLTRFKVKRRAKAILVPRLGMAVEGSAAPYGHKHHAGSPAPGSVGEAAQR